ncbi:MAG: 50S ribosomal protein L19 [Patescibacteria group bacterium]
MNVHFLFDFYSRYVNVTLTMANKIISPVNVEHRKKLDIRPGDTVRVWQKIEEDKGKFRLQAFEGLVLARKHGKEAGAMFTVRKVIDGIGVERIFPLYSPMIDEVEMVRRAKVRRAKLYFIRRKAAKEIRHQMRRTMNAKYEEEPVAEVALAETPIVETETTKKE